MEKAKYLAPMLQIRWLRLREVKELGESRSADFQLSMLSSLLEQHVSSRAITSAAEPPTSRLLRVLTLANTGVKLVGSRYSISQTVLTASWQQSGHWEESLFRHTASFRAAQSAHFLQQLRAVGSCGCRQPASWIYRNHRAAYFQLKGQSVNQSHPTKSLRVIRCCCVFKMVTSPISNLWRQHQQLRYNVVFELEHHKIFL